MTRVKKTRIRCPQRFSAGTEQAEKESQVGTKTVFVWKIVIELEASGGDDGIKKIHGWMNEPHFGHFREVPG